MTEGTLKVKLKAMDMLEKLQVVQCCWCRNPTKTALVLLSGRMHALKFIYYVQRKTLLIIVKERVMLIFTPKQCRKCVSLYEGFQIGWANLSFCLPPRSQ